MGTIEFREYSKKSKFTVADYDRSFTLFKEYADDKGIRLPRLDAKNWSILFIDLSYNDLCRLMEEQRPDFHDILIMSRNEVLRDAGVLKSEKDKKSGFEVFMKEVIGSLPKIIDDKAARELYTRTRDDDSKLEAAVEELRNHPAPRITIDVLNTIVAPVISVWASDVASSILVYYNQTIPRKGHPLARFKMKSPIAMVNIHIELIGQEISFYSLQKFFRSLFEAKLLFLRNEPQRGITALQKQLLESIDVHTIMYCYLLFRESTPRSYYAVVHDIIERQKGNLTREESLLYARVFN